MALILRRNRDSVQKYVDEHFGSIFKATAKSAEHNLQVLPIWKELEKQFSKEELQYFLHQWGRIVSQFNDDVYPTEEMQVIDTIKLEILMNRCLTQQQKVATDIATFEQMLEDERAKPIEQRDRDVIFNLDRILSGLRASQNSLNDQHQSLLKHKNDILKSMKATRDARVKDLEMSREKWSDTMRSIMTNRDLRDKLGKDMEKMRLAMEVELEKLGEYHTYINGEVDQPILTPENVRD